MSFPPGRASCRAIARWSPYAARAPALRRRRCCCGKRDSATSPISPAECCAGVPRAIPSKAAASRTMSHDTPREDHEHRHDQAHEHDPSHTGSELSEMDARVRALESLLVEKGYVDPRALDILIETYETK